MALYNVILPVTEQGIWEAYAGDVEAIQKLVPTSEAVATLKDLPFCADESALSIMKLYVCLIIIHYTRN